jgi:hypothetical protein
MEEPERRTSITPEEALRREEREAIREGRREFDQWLDDLFPGSIFWFPTRVYIKNVANTLGIPDSSQRSLASVGVTAIPLLAGYLAYRKTDGSIPWTVAASAGSIYAMAAFALGAAIYSFRGGGY